MALALLGFTPTPNVVESFFTAVKQGNVSEVEDLARMFHELLTEKADLDGLTPLLHAVMEERSHIIEIIKALIKYGANVYATIPANGQSSMAGWNALEIAQHTLSLCSTTVYNDVITVLSNAMAPNPGTESTHTTTAGPFAPTNMAHTFEDAPPDDPSPH